MSYSILVLIPKMFGVNRNKIYQVFNLLQMGNISGIKFLPISNTLNYNKIIIYFDKLSFCERSNYIFKRLNKGQDVKIVYDKNIPSFWKVYLHKNKNI